MNLSVDLVLSKLYIKCIPVFIRVAKEKKLRRWKDYVGTTDTETKENFSAKVCWPITNWIKFPIRKKLIWQIYPI